MNNRDSVPLPAVDRDTINDPARKTMEIGVEHVVWVHHHWFATKTPAGDLGEESGPVAALTTA